jgi:hypothetical protein
VIGLESKGALRCGKWLRSPRPLAGLAGAVLALAAAAEEPQPSLPANLVLDLRLFEARITNPDLQAMENLSFYIATDGRQVSANQWLSTIGTKVPEAFLAGLGWDRLPLEQGRAEAEWKNGARSFDTEIQVKRFEPGKSGTAQVRVRRRRGEKTLAEFTRTVNLEDGKTLVWSSRDLQIHPSEYIYHFREYENQERRGELYSQLARSSIFLIMALTLRIPTAEEAALGPTVELAPPPDARLPELESPLGIPLQGTVVVGFELDASGNPQNPHVLRSTVPEANPRVLAEASGWSFPDQAGERRRVRVTLKVDIP